MCIGSARRLREQLDRMRPDPPLESVQRRYGWPLGDSAPRDEEVVDWMVAVTVLI